MRHFIGKRAFASALSLLGLIVLVFFLSRLTGDPTSLFLPLDASLESRERFRELHGLIDHYFPRDSRCHHHGFSGRFLCRWCV